MPHATQRNKTHARTLRAAVAATACDATADAAAPPPPVLAAHQAPPPPVMYAPTALLGSRYAEKVHAYFSRTCRMGEYARTSVSRLLARRPVLAAAEPDLLTPAERMERRRCVPVH